MLIVYRFISIYGYIRGLFHIYAKCLKYMLTQQIWLSCSTPGSGWGGLGFESVSHQGWVKSGIYCSSACAGHNDLE